MFVFVVVVLVAIVLEYPLMALVRTLRIQLKIDAAG